MRVCAVLPALNEADALPRALAARPDGLRVIVVDNGSDDGTAEVAGALGVEVVVEPRRGFGAACWAGVQAASDADVIVFMDADGTCAWPDAVRVVAPVVDGQADLVLGRRVRSRRAPGAMPFHVAAANAALALACRVRAGVAVHDLGPLRAIRRDALVSLGIVDRTFGWPLEMVLRAGRAGLRVQEEPVAYLRRVGTSKVTGTLGGTARATARMARLLATFR